MIRNLLQTNQQCKDTVMSNSHRIGIALVALLAPFATSNLAHAHDEDLRNAKPRIGIISDDVARQRLKLAGVENAEILRREGQRIVARGVVGGQPVTLHMDALQGAITDAAEPQRRLNGPRVVGPGVMASAAAGADSAPRSTPTVIERSRVADPELMRDAAKTSVSPP